MMVPLTAMPPDVRMQIMLHMQNVQALHQMASYPHLSRGTTLGQLFDATISTLSPQDMHDFMTSVMAALQRRMPAQTAGLSDLLNAPAAPRCHIAAHQR